MAYLASIPNQNRLRVLAADSTPMSTQLLVEALARDPQLDMIESPSSASAVLHLLKRSDPHVVVVSVNLGENRGGGYDLVREIRSQSPATRVIVLLDASDDGSVVEAFRAGAQGVFCRTEPFRLLSKCIQCVHQGQIWASSSELQYVLDAFARPTLPRLQAKGNSPLSARETDVVRCLVEGLTNREISQREVIGVMVGDLQRIRLYPAKGFQIAQEIPPEVWAAGQKLIELGYSQNLVKE